MNTPDRDLTADEIKQASRHYCALNGIDPDVEQEGGQPVWQLVSRKVVDAHNRNRVLEKLYSDITKREAACTS